MPGLDACPSNQDLICWVLGINPSQFADGGIVTAPLAGASIGECRPGRSKVWHPVRQNDGLLGKAGRLLRGVVLWVTVAFWNISVHRFMIVHKRADINGRRADAKLVRR